MKKVIITVLGQDRPGILAAVSENLAEQNCNIENVSQMVLQLKFVGFFIVSLPTSLPLETFTNILKKKMTSMDLYIHVDQYS
ncbi:MAG: amino acid-binding protein, partial [Desulfobacteraceae bacterium 4572_19]